jgi:hypothetical protein
MYRSGSEVHLGHLVDEAEGHEGNGEPGEEDAHNNERAAYPRADSEVVFKDVGQLRVQPVRVGRKPVENPPAARSIQPGASSTRDTVSICILVLVKQENLGFTWE